MNVLLLQGGISCLSVAYNLIHFVETLYLTTDCKTKPVF
jgi:hypothetical protein